MPSGGPYRRIYEDGVRVEHPEGSAVSGESHVARPQLFAHSCRVGGNPHAPGPSTQVSYETATDVVVNLPRTLERMDDRELIELADAEEGVDVFHVIDLAAAGPY